MLFTDNHVLRFPLFLRVLAFVLCAAWWLIAGPLRKHFLHEIQAFYPMKAIDPSTVGVDPDDWTARRAKDTALTVHIETVQRARDTDIGKQALYPGDTITVEDATATPAQWLAVTHVAAVNAKPTEEVMQRNGFTQTEWRTFRDALVSANLMQKIGNGDHGQNAGYDFTPEGKKFFQEKRWERRH